MNSNLFICLKLLCSMCCVCTTHRGIVGSTVTCCHNAIFFTQAARTNETLCALCFRESSINRVIEYKDCESPDLSIFTSLASLLCLSLCLDAVRLVSPCQCRLHRSSILHLFVCLSIYPLKQTYLKFFSMKPTS